jgi:hypothetical protein
LVYISLHYDVYNFKLTCQFTLQLILYFLHDSRLILYIWHALVDEYVDMCSLALEGRVLVGKSSCESDAQCHESISCRRNGQFGTCISGRCWCYYPPSFTNNIPKLQIHSWIFWCSVLINKNKRSRCNLYLWSLNQIIM